MAESQLAEKAKEIIGDLNTIAESICMSIDKITIDIGTLIAAVVAIGVAIIGIFEYKNQNKLKRVEQFIGLRKRFKENDVFNKIRELLLHNDENIKNVPTKEKTDFLGFYEEIAIMVNSGVMRKKVSYYMFGYYAIRCWESEGFWCNIYRNSIYWSVFKKFAEDMKKIEKTFKFNMKDFKL